VHQHYLDIYPALMSSQTNPMVQKENYVPRNSKQYFTSQCYQELVNKRNKKNKELRINSITNYIDCFQTSR